jgi:AcrR family transcriptional regulator
VSYSTSPNACKLIDVRTIANGPQGRERPPAPRPRTRNARGEGGRLREEIVHAAIRMVDAGRAEAITLRAVAREAGISAPSIYDHFAGVEQILGAVIGECFLELNEEVVAAGQSASDPVQRLHAGCEAYLRFARRRPERYALLFRREWPADADIGEQEKASADAAFDTLVQSIADCVRAGRSDSDDPFADAVALWSGLHGYASLRTMHEGFPWPPGQETVRRLVENLGRIRAAQD